MRFTPGCRCCAPPTCAECGAVAPAEIDITIADTTDDFCTDCELWNGTWRMTKIAVCGWEYFRTPFRCGGPDSSQPGKLTLVYNNGQVTLELQGPNFTYTARYAGSWDCVSGATLNLTEVDTFDFGLPPGQRRCNYPSTVTLTPV